MRSMFSTSKEVWSDDPENPVWDGAGRVHDWRNHVSERLRAIWGTFTPEQRRVLYEDAYERAGQEHWD